MRHYWLLTGSGAVFGLLLGLIQPSYALAGVAILAAAWGAYRMPASRWHYMTTHERGTAAAVLVADSALLIAGLVFQLPIIWALGLAGVLGFALASILTDMRMR